jgi:hypothetical protein
MTDKNQENVNVIQQQANLRWHRQCSPSVDPALRVLPLRNYTHSLHTPRMSGLVEVRSAVVFSSSNIMSKRLTLARFGRW